MKVVYLITPEMSCETCIYFVRHYMLGETGRFVPLSCGHCGMGQSRITEMGELCSMYRKIGDLDAPRAAYQINWKWD